MEIKNLEVGDTLEVSNVFGVSRYLITRVTKTLAMAKRAEDGYEHRFKREVSDNMSHPTVRHNNLNKYKVIR